MSKVQFFLAIALGVGVSLFAGAALPDYAGSTLAHVLIGGASTGLFAGIFAARNRSAAKGDCGCPGDSLGHKLGKKDACRADGSDCQPAKPVQGGFRLDAKPADGNKLRATGSGDCSVEIQHQPQTDGSVKVTIVASGYTKREWSERIRPRLERVRGIKWQHPTNLGQMQRQMEGSIAAGTNAGAVLAALQQVS